MSFLQVFVQSDVLEVALDMRNQFDDRPDIFSHVNVIGDKPSCDSQGWVLHNPMGIRTEREIHAKLEGARIYRRIYEKVKWYFLCPNHMAKALTLQVKLSEFQVSEH